MDQLDGVDFAKGCYVGQEVVSRMEHRGTARNRVVPVAFDAFGAGRGRSGHGGRQAGRHHGLVGVRPRPRHAAARPRRRRAGRRNAAHGRRRCAPAGQTRLGALRLAGREQGGGVGMRRVAVRALSGNSLETLDIRAKVRPEQGRRWRSDVTRGEFDLVKERVDVVEREVDGEKMVTRHILEQTRRNSDDLAAIKTRLDRVERKVDGIEQKVDGSAGGSTAWQSRRRGLPATLARSLRMSCERCWASAMPSADVWQARCAQSDFPDSWPLLRTPTVSSAAPGPGRTRSTSPITTPNGACPEFDDRALYEKLVLDGFQAGLSWITILRKRDNFRRAFDDFDPAKIARYDKRKVERLMQDAGIVRNRMKIEGAVLSARAWLDVMEKGPGFSRAAVGLPRRQAEGQPLPLHRRRCRPRPSCRAGCPRSSPAAASSSAARPSSTPSCRRPAWSTTTW